LPIYCDGNDAVNPEVGRDPAPVTGALVIVIRGDTLRSRKPSGAQTMEKPYYVHAVWDDEARVWVASSDDVPGLATESETAEALVEKLRFLIPELLSLNGRTVAKPITFELLTRRFEHAA
jgi:hypothetical protein